MKKDDKFKIIKYIFIVLFASYTAIYIMVNLGYYEYTNYNKKVFTEEQIKKFEEDIKNGIVLDANEYLVQEDTVNREKQMGLKVSEMIGVISRKSIEEIFKLLNKFVET